MSVATLRAKVPGISGTLTVNPEDPLRSTLTFEADTRSVTTGHQRQEEFMRGEHWLDAENHPTLTFRSTSVEPRGGSEFVVHGDLTLRGVTRSIEFPLTFNGVVADGWGLRTGFSSTFSLDRRDFGITWNREFDWGLMAGEQLEVMLDIELSHADESLALKPKA
jgi:polyisoprenoid-binding protein YceI